MIIFAFDNNFENEKPPLIEGGVKNNKYYFVYLINLVVASLLPAFSLTR